MPEFLRFKSEAGEFTAPASRKEALVKEGARVLDKKRAVDAQGNPLPYKPTILRRSPVGQEAAHTSERPSGQKANTEKEQV